MKKTIDWKTTSIAMLVITSLLLAYLVLDFQTNSKLKNQISDLQIKLDQNQRLIVTANTNTFQCSDVITKSVTLLSEEKLEESIKTLLDYKPKDLVKPIY